MKTLLTRYLALSFFLVLCNWQLAFATHIISIEMTYQCLNPATRQYRFTVHYSEVCPSALTGMSQIITFEAISGGCASFTATATQVGAGVDQRQQVCPTQTTNCSGGAFASVMRYTMQVDVTLPPGCNWRAYTTNCCRATAITNLTSPDLYGTYIDLTVNSNTTLCNNSPTFASQPVFYACAGQLTSYNHGTIDIDGDSLSYQLIDPRDYISPFNNVPFAGGLSATTPVTLSPATMFNFNSSTGQMSFTPQAGLNQRAVIVVRISEYRNGVLIGTYMRELQVTVSSTCTNNNPTTSPVSNVSGSSLSGTTFSTCPGQTMTFRIVATDPDVGQTLSAVHNITTNLPGSTVTTSGTNPLTLNVSWPVPLAPLPNYTFVITFSDNACPILGQQIMGFLIDIGANVTITADSIYCPPGPQIKPITTTANAGTFSWSPSAGLSCTNCQNPVATVSAPITYTVTYTDAATGCSAVASHQFRQHVMNLTTTPTSPITWCTGSPGVQVTARLNGDPGTTIVPNPNRYNINPVTFSSIGGGGWTSLTLSDDQLSAAVPVGFNFTFYGNVYSQIYISSNGFLSFNAGAGSGCCSGQALPNTTQPNDVIALAWEDLYPPGGGTVRYKTIGAAPNRRFIVQYNNIQHYSAGNAITTQAILNETTNCVEIHTSAMPSDGGLHTMGLENSSGTIAHPYPGRNSANWSIAASEAYRWCPGNDTVGTGITYLWSPATGVSNVNAQAPTITPAAAPTTYTVTANDGICTAQRNVVFSCTLLDVLCNGFNATFEGEQVHLNWATLGEEDVRGYAIERSNDGITFEQVAWVNSKGNSSQGHSYAHLDNMGISRGNVYYYRIISHDLNGDKEQLCDVISVSTGQNAVSSVSVRPNPTTNTVEIVVHSANAGDVNIKVFDLLGQPVLIKNANALQVGINAYQVNLESLPAGTYLLRIGNDMNGYSTQRLVKINP